MGTIQRAASGVDLREHHIRFTNTKKKKHDLPLITTSNITKNEMTYSKNTKKNYVQAIKHTRSLGRYAGHKVAQPGNVNSSYGVIYIPQQTCGTCSLRESGTRGVREPASEQRSFVLFFRQEQFERN